MEGCCGGLLSIMQMVVMSNLLWSVLWRVAVEGCCGGLLSIMQMVKTALTIARSADIGYSHSLDIDSSP